jgi:hypothetical protein
MNKGIVDGLEECDDYDDYYGNLQACNDGRRMAHRNAEFHQKLYLDMLVEEKRIDDRHNAHISAGGKTENEGK